MNRSLFENSVWKQIQGGQVLEGENAYQLRWRTATNSVPTGAPSGPHDPWSNFLYGTMGFCTRIDKIAAIMQFSFPREYSRKIFPPTVVLVSSLAGAQQNPANREFAEVDRINQQRRAGTEMPKP